MASKTEMQNSFLVKENKNSLLGVHDTAETEFFELQYENLLKIRTMFKMLSHFNNVSTIVLHTLTQLENTGV